MKNDYPYTLIEIAELDRPQLDEDTIGWHCANLVDETPFFQVSNFVTNTIEFDKNSEVLTWHGYFKNEAFGQAGVNISIWIKDEVHDTETERYLVAQFTNSKGKQLDVLGITSVLLNLDKSGQLEIEVPNQSKEELDGKDEEGLDYYVELDNEAQDERESEGVVERNNHRLRFDGKLQTPMWLSSHTIKQDQLIAIFGVGLITNFPNQLEIGFQWNSTIDLTLGHGLDHWFKNPFESLEIKAFYRKRFPTDEMEFRFSVSTVDQKDIKQKNATVLKLDSISLFFNYKESKMKFEGFGLHGYFATLVDDKALKQIDFFGRLHITNGRLSLAILNDYSVKDLAESVGLNKANDSTFNALIDAVESLQFYEFRADFNVFSFEFLHAHLAIKTTEPIRIDQFEFYPDIRLAVDYPLNRGKRVVEVEMYGIIHVFDSFFTVNYSYQNASFFLTQSGKLNSTSVLKYFKFPTHPDFSVDVLELEFTALKPAEHWIFGGSISIENNWHFTIEGKKPLEVSFEHLHASFHHSHEEFDFHIDGQLKIGDVVLRADADYHSLFGYSLSTSISDLAIHLNDFPKWLGFNKNGEDKNSVDFNTHVSDGLFPELNIRNVMIDCHIPLKRNSNEKVDDTSISTETVTPEFSFIVAIDTEVESRKNAAVPLDFLYFELNWAKKLEWTALVHFTFVEPTANRKATELFLESNYKDGAFTFTGSLKELHIDDLLGFIERKFETKIAEELPDFIRQSTVELLEVTLVKGGQDWSFDFEVDVITPIKDPANPEEQLKTKLKFEIERKTESDKDSIKKSHWTVNFELTLETSHFKANFTFHHQKNSNHLLVDLTLTDSELNISDLLVHFLPTDITIPSLDIGLQEVFFAVYSDATDKEKTKRKLFFGAQLEAKIDLTKAEFLTKIIPADATIGIENFRLVYASNKWSIEEIKALSAFADAADHSLPFPANGTDKKTLNSEKTDESDLNSGLAKGFAVSGKLKIGELSHDFVVNPGNTDGNSDNIETDLPTEDSFKAKGGDRTQAGQLVLKKDTDETTTGKLTKWFKIDKKIGPIHIQRFGIQFQFQSMEIALLLDAGLQISVLSAAVTGLGVRTPINDFVPNVQLKGLGFDFKREPIEIGGAIIAQSDEGIDLGGMLTLSFKELNMTILGAYQSIGEQAPSLLLYGNLNYPIGGPPFFFVEGLAAGIGLHRKIRMPSIDAIANFPLVSMVMNPTELQGAESLTNGIAALKKTIPAQQDQFFFAAGIKFSTFKVINSFVLLVLSLGDQTELDLIGYSELVLPKNVGRADPVAQARLLIRAAFIPNRGVLEVEARLDPRHSYLLSKACKLQGGFAFYAWFKDDETNEKSPKAGDFVLTLGGYHPQFNVPAHYPKVPRLGFNWEVDKHTHLKGSLYFALTPAAIMAGGLLEGMWAMDHITASFRLAFNVLMQWQPFHYEADAELSIKAGYHKGLLQFDGEVHAKINIWGPDFGGNVSLKVLFIKVKASFGAPRVSKKVPLSWQQFADKMLPGDAFFNGRVVKGHIPGDPKGGNEFGAVSSNDCQLRFETAVPYVNYKFDKVQKEVGKSFALQAMGIDRVSSTLTVNIRHVDEGFNATSEFEITSFNASGPVALWGKLNTKKMNSPTLVDDLGFGFTIKPKKSSYILKGEGLVFDRKKDKDQISVKHVAAASAPSGFNFLTNAS